MMAISATIPISISITPVPFTSTFSITDSDTATGGIFSGTMISMQEYVEGIYSYTSVLTGQLAALTGTEVITVVPAPAWYAPNLPRPIADVGWTFEQAIGPGDTVPRFTNQSFASFAGHIISLPFSLIRSVWDTLTRFGPIGLFLGWLFIMAIFVFSMEFIRLLIALLSVVIRFIVRLVELLGGWIPTGG